MSLLDKFRKGAQKAGIQATAFVQTSTSKVASGSREFMQGFSLPGEAEKAANILESFLGVYAKLLHCFEYIELTDLFLFVDLRFSHVPLMVLSYIVLRISRQYRTQ